MIGRREIIEAIGEVLSSISKANGYNTDFDKITYWQATDTAYKKNHLDYRDVTEDYTKRNNTYHCQLNVEIVAIVYGDRVSPSQYLGTLALEDLIKAVSSLSNKLKNASVDLKRSHKFVETKGVGATQVELLIIVTYRF